MIVRRWAEFTTTLPDDGVEDETGFIQWPGKNVAEALSEILIGLGCTEVEIFDLEHAGYDVGFRLGKRASAARVTVIDNPLIAFDQKHQPEHLDFLRRVSDALALDGRFQKVRWFTDDEVLTGVEGAMSPLQATSNHQSDGLFGPSPVERPKRGSMKVRPWAQFTTDVRGTDGVPETLGSSVTNAISQMLIRSGSKSIRRSYLHGFGWILKFLVGKRRLMAGIHLVDEHTGKYQVGLWQRSWMSKILGLKRLEYVEILRRLNTELAKDPRFHDITWFSEREMHSGAEGAPSPVEDAA